MKCFAELIKLYIKYIYTHMNYIQRYFHRFFLNFLISQREYLRKTKIAQ
jgi:hypothetical protein